VLQLSETSRALGLAFMRLEMALAVRIVVANTRARTRRLNTQVVEHVVEADSGHRGTTVVGQRDLAFGDGQALDSLSDQVLG
jgi:hypothetical protein